MMKMMMMMMIKHSNPSNVHCWAWSLCDICEQLVSIEAPLAEHQENRGDVA